jgi:CPA2 family monovalent cation:H+ antiporter-2
MEFLDPGIVSQFVIFFVLAAVGGIISARVKQPAVVMLLIIGAIIGPNALGLVSSGDLISFFLNIGAVFLLFAIGVEFSIAKLMSSGFRAVIITSMKMGALFLFGYQAAVIIGLGPVLALYLGAVFSITSTTIMVKMLEQKGMIMKSEFNLLFSMLVIEDIVAVMMITFLSALSSQQEVTVEHAVRSIFLALALLGLSYKVVKEILRVSSTFITKYQTEDTMIFLGIGLATLFSLFAATIGLTPAIGAFIAGSVIASMPNSPALNRAVRPFILAFSALFFLSVGMLVQIPSLANLIGLYIPLIVGFLVVSFVIVTLLAYFTGFRGNSAVFSGCAMLVLGEFSLLIASGAPKAHGFDMLSLASVGVLVTAIASSFALDKTSAILQLFESAFPRSVLRAFRLFSSYFGRVIQDFEPGGRFSMRLLSETSSISHEIVWVGVVGLLDLGLDSLVGGVMLNIGPFPLKGRALIFMVSLVILLYPLLSILRALMRILDTLSSSVNTFAATGEHSLKTIVRNALLAALLFGLALSIQFLVYALRLPWVFQLGSIPFMLLSFLFLWDITRHLPHMRGKFR